MGRAGIPNSGVSARPDSSFAARRARCSTERVNLHLGVEDEAAFA